MDKLKTLTLLEASELVGGRGEHGVGVGVGVCTRVGMLVYVGM